MTLAPPAPDTNGIRRQSHQHLDDDALVQEVAFDLRRVIDGEARFDPGTRHLYATDSSNYRQVPIGVVRPRSIDDVVATVEVCRRHAVPITSRGGGTSLSGETTNVAVIIDFSRHMDAILELDPATRRARVQPGVVLDDLRDAAERHHLTFGPDPSTHDRCTLGGMIGNNSCGLHSVMAGRTVDNVESLDVLLYDGTRLTLGPIHVDEWDALAARDTRVGRIHRDLRRLGTEHADLIAERFPDIPRRVSGYNLDELVPDDDGMVNLARAVVGTEGTCVIVLEATLDLVESPPARTLMVLGYPDVFEAADHAPEVLAAGPIALEGLDLELTENMRTLGIHVPNLSLLPEGSGWLLVEFGADTREESDAKARQLQEQLADDPTAPSVRIYDDPSEEAHVWTVRESGLGATAFVPGEPDKWPGWEDAAVPPERLGGYLREYRDLLDRYGLQASLYGHFGDGCVHCRISFELTTEAGIATFRAFTSEAADLVVAHGGSNSGEHGDGQARAELLEAMYGPELVEAFRTFKSAWDPDGRLNPGKVVDPYARDTNLRLGIGYEPWDPETHFTFPDDEGSFARAALRCVGVGSCRSDGGTMCPSYQVTREEQHSTRGRARLLFEMLQPDSDLDGWRDESVREALDLCLACKGCKTDCPIDVDMATYKAEFLSHHYEGRLRPVAAYSLGLIAWWVRLARFAPGIANRVLTSPLAPTLKRVAGVARERPAPAFAPQTFRDWFAARGGGTVTGGPEVMLFPDSFTDHLEPAIARDAVDVLERLGWHVTIPDKGRCCARPTFDYGMLDLARIQLSELARALAPAARRGVPIVGLEPSCVASLRDELTALLGDDDDAATVASQTHTFAEFLASTDADLPGVDRAAVVHGHCHHDAVMGRTADREVYDTLGLDWHDLDAGCCGLAGSFGFEAGEKYEVSVAAAERRLLPAVRDTDPDTLVLADGFSCRTQLRQLGGGRQPYHLAQLVAAALRGEVPADAAEPPDPGSPLTRRDRVALLAAGGAALAAGALGAWGARRRTP